MRVIVLRALLLKELRRVAAHRGSVGMVLLIVVTAVLMSFAGARALSGVIPGGQASRCVIDVWHENAWVAHLRSHVPRGLRDRISFRSLQNRPGFIRYPIGSVGIQLRPDENSGGYKLWTWHPSGDPAAAAWCESFVWRESRRFFLTASDLDATTRALVEREVDGIDGTDDAWALRESHARFRERVDPTGTRVPRFDVERSPFRTISGAGAREAVAMGLVLLSLFFVGIFLLPSMTSEERERGVASAIALSPARPSEIVLARLGFYFVFAFGLASLVGGIAVPSAWVRPFFWAVVAVIALGSVAIGFTLASVSKTQRGASLAALCYLFATGVLMVTAKDNALEPVTWFLLERHGPTLLLVAFSGVTGTGPWLELGFTGLLSLGWVALASFVYRRFGWRA